MLRRATSFLRNLFLCLALIFSVNSLATEKLEKQTIIEPGGFLHAVFFWLKKPNDEEDRKAFEKYLKNFVNGSRYVKSKFIGTAAPSDREVVDSSYTYVLVLSFSSKEDQDKYQVEPVHLKFVENAQHLWKKVVVYDAFNSL